MVKRYCPKCNAMFNQKSHYDNHIGKKYDCTKSITETKLNKNINNAEICGFVQKPCGIMQDENLKLKNNIESIIIEQINQDNNFSCSHCKKKFSSKSTLNRHQKDNCKVKKNIDIEKENIFKLLLDKDKEKDKKINDLEKQNKLLMNKINKLISLKENKKLFKTINNNQTITNNISNNQNNIIMVNFGKEDLSIIDERLFIDKIIKKPMVSGVKIPDEVLKIIHFNPTYPQLSNIYISDINRDKCMVWEDGEWKLSSIDNMPQIMDKICLFSKEQINTLKNKYPDNKSFQDRLNVIKKYNNMIDDDYLDELKDDAENNKNEIKRCEDFQKNTHNILKKTLYNEGKKIKKNVK